jgi:hypothetical protein
MTGVFTTRDPRFQFTCAGCTWDQRHCGGRSFDILSGRAKGTYRCACHRCQVMKPRETT